MESTGHYGDNILHYLYEKGFTIYVMNPKLTSDIRKSTSLRKTKTDKIDCRAIAKIVRDHREELTPFTIKSYHISELKSLTRYRQNLVNDRSRLKNSVKRLINILFPEYDEMFSDIHGETSYAILTEFPGHNELATANIIRLTDIGRFKNSDKLVAYAGISPSTYQSGQYKASIARMEKRGSRQLRYAIMLAAEHVARSCQYFSLQMQKKRIEGKTYRVAVSHIARNLIRLIYRMELTGETYHTPSLD